MCNASTLTTHTTKYTKLGEAYEYVFSVACCVVSKPAIVDNSAELRTGIYVLLRVCGNIISLALILGESSVFVCYSARFVLFQHDAVLRSNPGVTQYTFPKDAGAAARENVCRAPGPGQYNLPTGVGKQVCCRCRFNCVLSFPKALTKKTQQNSRYSSVAQFFSPETFSLRVFLFRLTVRCCIFAGYWWWCWWRCWCLWCWYWRCWPLWCRLWWCFCVFQI